MSISLIVCVEKRSRDGIRQRNRYGSVVEERKSSIVLHSFTERGRVFIVVVLASVLSVDSFFAKSIVFDFHDFRSRWYNSKPTAAKVHGGSHFHADDAAQLNSGPRMAIQFISFTQTIKSQVRCSKLSVCSPQENMKMVPSRVTSIILLSTVLTVEGRRVFEFGRPVDTPVSNVRHRAVFLEQRRLVVDNSVMHNLNAPSADKNIHDGADFLTEEAIFRNLESVMSTSYSYSYHGVEEEGSDALSASPTVVLPHSDTAGLPEDTVTSPTSGNEADAISRSEVNLAKIEDANAKAHQGTSAGLGVAIAGVGALLVSAAIYTARRRKRSKHRNVSGEGDDFKNQDDSASAYDTAKGTVCDSAGPMNQPPPIAFEMALAP